MFSREFNLGKKKACFFLRIRRQSDFVRIERVFCVNLGREDERMLWRDFKSDFA